MCKSKRIIFSTLFLVSIWLASACLAAPTVSHIHYGVHNGHTRVVIDLTGRVAYKVYRVANPERIAVDLRSVRSASDLRSFTIADGVVRGVRINRLSWGSQVVLDVRQQANCRDVYLESIDGMPHRIVLDVSAVATPPRPTVNSSKSGGPVATRTKAAGKRTVIVAIDAGHGGTDPGALGRHRLVEKREALTIAKRVAAEIDSHSGFKAVLTRNGDEFLSLPSRSKIAQRKGADIFVSIHLNSAPRKSARGIEVFFLSPAGAKSTASRLLANKNRAAKELGVVGSDNADILHMLVDVNQQSMMQRSSLLAEEILESMRRRNLPPTRSVKQRSFAVLKSIAMPSVMVEAGFITNPKDAKLIKSDSGKTRIAKAVADGVIAFLKKYPPPDDVGGEVVVHRVKRGETLWRISKKYNTTVASIQATNRLGKSKMIKVGQELVIR
ncbi:MAG: N-acetylmuramoyl-L-alanine amidase [Candidatus Krumholzibacteria bacterium]|nr:N-acetylmuramoyl-L-alanine amidase [Candidatus Krumholzibacteria bacterium]